MDKDFISVETGEDQAVLNGDGLALELPPYAIVILIEKQN